MVRSFALENLSYLYRELYVFARVRNFLAIESRIVRLRKIIYRMYIANCTFVVLENLPCLYRELYIVRLR